MNKTGKGQKKMTQFKYGIELEGFQRASKSYGASVIPPRIGLPLDGFPGLVEFRTVGAMSLEDAVWNVFRQYTECPEIVDVSLCEHTFTASERGQIMSRVSLKEGAVVSNIYNKSPKNLGNRTIASCQINISMEIVPSFTDSDGVYFPERYGLLDIPTIVRRLDKEFEDDIADTRRQKGFYSIKHRNIRLEYRSLPNCVFPTSADDIPNFISRIKKAVEGE